MSNYKDIKKIGSGGFGEVWKCERDDDNQIFAKKKLHNNVDEDGVKRFIREVRILSSLDHPNIVKVVGKRLQKKIYFYIMPLYSTSLKKELATIVGNDGRIIPIYSAILDGIEYAHSQGVIHRDLKPENVLLNSDSDVVLSDFGLGRSLDSDSTRQTMTGYGMGTILYMAPEQLADAKNADERSDVYSLGRMLYELYSGPITSFAQDTSSLPPGITFFVNKCTQHIPQNRFQTVADLKHAWQSLFDSSYRQTELDELMTLRTELTPPARFTDADVSRLLELIIKYQEDPDLLHETIMQIDPAVVGEMCRQNVSETKHIIDSFIEYVTSQGWAFSYTDKIGNKCKGLHQAIQDFDIKASLVICAMEVGIYHNRWHVLGIFTDLISAPKIAGEEIALAAYLSQVDERSRERVAEHIILGKLHPSLRHFFNFSESS